MTDPVALLDHPIVEIACRMMRPDASGRWTFESKDADILEAVLIQEKNDPRLDGAILGLFEVALDLEQKNSLDAAGALLAVIGRVGPQLRRSERVDALVNAIEAQRQMARFSDTPQQHTAPDVNAPTPEHTMRPSAFLQSIKRKLR